MSMKKSSEYKRECLETLAAWHTLKYREPELRNLFFELTSRCNEKCLHCGSSCGPAGEDLLSAEDFKSVLDEVKREFAPDLPMICVTGGEPLLRRDLFDIMGYAHSLGFRWGMTTNGTLITPEIAHKLAQAGMGTVSVSLDGLAQQHDRLRQTPGGFDRAVAGIHNLIDTHAFRHVQVTTVVHHRNIGDLPGLFRLLEGIDIDSWRIINMEPIGRALQYPELMLTTEDYRAMFDYIRAMRQEGWPVSYGCSHWLGETLEGETRDWYFMCSAGIYTASIMSNGDVGACLDIERRPETIMGNIRTDRFTDLWRSGFDIFRRDFAALNPTCSACPDRRFCTGDARHSWDYDKNEPMLCFKGILF